MGSNQRPIGYEPTALTPELRAPRNNFLIIEEISQIISLELYELDCFILKCSFVPLRKGTLMTQYIGVTGITRKDQILALQRMFDPDPDAPKLMVGILASAKTVDGRRNKYPRQFPLATRIPELMTHIDPARAFGLVHYSPYQLSYVSIGEWLQNGEVLEGDCEFFLDATPREIAGFGGFQFNMPLPSRSRLRRIQRRFAYASRAYRSVLQFWPQQIAKLAELIDADERDHLDPANPADVLRWHYEVTEDDPRLPFSALLLDASGGFGKPMDVSSVLAMLRSLLDDAVLSESLQYAVAGGLCAETVPQLAPIVELYPKLSIDAQGRLRDGDDRLNLDATKRYIDAAQKLLAG